MRYTIYDVQESINGSRFTNYEVEQISIAALEKRIGLWDAIEEQLSLTMETA